MLFPLFYPSFCRIARFFPFLFGAVLKKMANFRKKRQRWLPLIFAQFQTACRSRKKAIISSSVSKLQTYI
jgi:hypothetical protein